MRSYGLDELAWPAVREVLDDDPRLMIPVGALEQHGPHLPLGANTLVAERVVAEVSRTLGLLRAPVLSYGVIAAGDPRPGSVGLGRKTLHRSVNELLGRWERHGVREFILVTAHRYEPHLEALLMALSSESVTRVYDLYQIDVTDLLEGDPAIEHAGEFETSLLLHLAPDRVDREAAVDHRVDEGAWRRYTRGRMPTPPPDGSGVLGWPSRATAEKGEALFARLVETLAAAVESPAPGTDGD